MKKNYFLFFMALLLTCGSAFAKKEVVFVTTNANTRDSIVIDAIAGYMDSSVYNVTTLAIPGSLEASSLATCNAADLVIMGRALGSASIGAGVWDDITAPVLSINCWGIRNNSGRGRWVPTGTCANVATGNTDTLLQAIIIADDPVFYGIGAATDTFNLWQGQFSIFAADDGSFAGNGKILAKSTDGRPLLMRWEAGVEFYEGSGRIPAGPRAYFGNGSDDGGNLNYFGFLADGETIFFREIDRLLGKKSVVFVTTNANTRDSIVIDAIEKYKGGMYSVVTLAIPGSLEASSLELCNAADAVIMGRALGSASIGAGVWDEITSPVISTNCWGLRNNSGRGRWVPTGTCANVATGNTDTILQAIIVADDPVFSSVGVATDTFDLWKGQFSIFAADDGSFAGNGQILAKSTDGRPLLMRWKANKEFYPGSGRVPKGPRSYIGNGSDDGGNLNYFGFLPDGETVFFNELNRTLGKKSVVFVTTNANTRDSIVIDAIEKYKDGSVYHVTTLAIPGSLEASSLELCNAADVVIMGRALGSASIGAGVWDDITAPVLSTNCWGIRNNSGRGRWVPTGTCANVATGNTDTILQAIIVADDPVFSSVGVATDTFDLWKGQFSIFAADDGSFAGNGQILATSTDNRPLLMRWKANKEFYPGSGRVPKGPRSYIGNGSDDGGNLNYFGFLPDGESVFFNELARISAKSEIKIVRDIMFITDGSMKDSVQIDTLKAAGYSVDVFIVQNFYDAPQDSIDKINASSVVIFGRGPGSGTLNGGSGYALQKRITRPIIMNGVYAARNGAWFANKGPVHYQDGDGAPDVRDTIYAKIQIPGDDVFSGVTLVGDSIGWSEDPEDIFINDTMTNGTVVALATNIITKGGLIDTALLFVRWDEGMKMFEGISAQTGVESYIPAAPRTYFGFGNDAIETKDHYYPLTGEAQTIYFAEIDRLIDANFSVYDSYLATNSDIGDITADVAGATFNTPVHADTLVYTLTVPVGTTEVILTATTADANASVLDATKFDAVDTVAVDASAKFTVIAEDGFGTTTYTVNVVEAIPSNNADLSALAVDGGDLSPVFAAATTSYTVEPSQASVTLTGTAADAAASVAYDPSQTVDVSAAPATVTITVTAEDASTKDYTVVVDQYVGINTIAEAGIELYPNPAKENVTLTGLQAGTSIYIMNAVGQSVYNTVAEQGRLDIDVNNYQKGIYMIKIEMNGQVYTTRFVKR